jgi:ribosomal subunit interface protein
MQITISGKQVDMSDALRIHVEQHLNNAKAKYFDHAQEARVTFGRARGFFTCDIHLHPARELAMHGTGEAATAHAAFDIAAEHAAKQMRRFRRRMNEHNRDSANKERSVATE